MVVKKGRETPKLASESFDFSKDIALYCSRYAKVYKIALKKPFVLRST
jgi:hypothetical protein